MNVLIQEQGCVIFLLDFAIILVDERLKEDQFILIFVQNMKRAGVRKICMLYNSIMDWTPLICLF